MWTTKVGCKGSFPWICVAQARMAGLQRGRERERNDLWTVMKRQKEVGEFIHQQDCIFLGGVVREEGLDPMLEEGEKSFLDSPLFLVSPLPQSISSTSTRAVSQCIHSFIHFFISYVIHFYSMPGCAKHWGENEEDKTQISFSALVKISHRLSVYFRIKTSLPCLPCRAPYVLAPDSIHPQPHCPSLQAIYTVDSLLSINMSGRIFPVSPAACAFCLLSNLTSSLFKGWVGNVTNLPGETFQNLFLSSLKE